MGSRLFFKHVMAKKAAKKQKSTKVVEILGHRKIGSKLELKVQIEGAKTAKYVPLEGSGAPKKMLSDYKKQVKEEIAEKNKERQERREAAKPEEKASKRGRSVKKVNYSLKALRDAYEPVSDDSEDDFDVAAELAEKEEIRKENAKKALERKKSQKRKRAASKKKSSNKKRKKSPKKKEEDKKEEEEVVEDAEEENEGE